jgi:hypothetical protein
MNKVRQQLHITAEWISDYAQSIGAPLQMIKGDLIAPATMPIIFWQFFDIPWLKTNVPLIHGTQHFTYQEPITAGMVLDCELSLTRMDKKEVRQEWMTFYYHTLIYTCGGNLIGTADTLLIRAGD